MERILRNSGGSKELWLNVGSGAYPEAGFLNLDNHVYLLAAPLYPIVRRWAKGPRAERVRAYHEASRRAHFVRYDCRQPLRFSRPAVDHILCSHFLEHVYPNEAVEIVDGFAKALKPGGTLHLIVPDLESLARQYLEARERADAASHFVAETVLSSAQSPSWRYRLLELLGFQGLQHRWMYDRKSLSKLVEAAGMTLLDRNDTPSAHVRRDDADSLHIVAQKPG
jgi:hypothetical protein